MLQARLRECNMDEQCKKDSSLEALDMLSTFESRIGLLLGQVNFYPILVFKMDEQNPGFSLL
jgi:hypothetical protein